MYCSNCGKELPDGTRFCRFCGFQQEDVIVSPPPGPQPAALSKPPKPPKKTLKIVLLTITFLLVIAAAVILTPFLMQKVSQKRYEMKMAAGQRYLDEMDYEQAVIAYKAAIKIDPRNLDAYIELSDVYLAQDDSEAAANLLERAMDIVTSGYENEEDIIGDSRAVLTKLADIRTEEKDFSQARDIYEIGKKYLPKHDWDSEEENLTESERELYQQYIVNTLVPAYGLAKLDEGIYNSFMWQENFWDPAPFTGLVSVVIDDLDGDSSLDMAAVVSRADELTGGDGSYTYSNKSFDLYLYQLENGEVTEKHSVKDAGVLEDQCFGFITAVNYQSGSKPYLCIRTSAGTYMEYSYDEIRVYQVIDSQFKLQTGFRYVFSEGEILTELKNSGEPVNLRYITHWGTVDEDGRDLDTDSGNSGEYDSMTEAMDYVKQTLNKYDASKYWDLYSDTVIDTLKNEGSLVGAYTVRDVMNSSDTNYIVRVYDNSELRTVVEKGRLDLLKSISAKPAVINEKKITDVLKNSTGSEICNIDLSYPELTPVKGLNGIDKINEYFRALNQDLHDSMVKTVRQDSDEYAILYPYEQSTTYSIGLNTGKVLGIVVDSYDYYGGAHGYDALSYYNFDMYSGLLLTLSDIAVDPVQFQAFLKQEILNQIWANNDAEGMFPEYHTTLQNYDLNTNWLLDETGFTFVFNAYELGSYAAGRFTYTVPYESCGAYLNGYGKAVVI